MAKGDDIKIKKKNKAIRKKLAKDPSSVSTRVASLIAAKKRRQSGKRRQCQGMCFSLPTPEDPYNERLGKEDISTKKNKKRTFKDITSKQQKGMLSDDQMDIDTSEKKRLKRVELENVQSIDCLEKVMSTNLDKEDSQCPSMFLCRCLESVCDSLIVDSWGVGFWKSYIKGNDVLDVSGCSPSLRQIIWIGASAADQITQREKNGPLLDIPFLLYLVPSQERANEVRCMLKPLKVFGVHTVSLHSGTSVEHQIQGLRSCEPEFFIATPERLKELVLLKAVDMSAVSLLVVDLMDSLSHCLDMLKWIKNSLNGNSCTVVFQGQPTASNVQSAKSILREPFHTLSFKKP